MRKFLSLVLALVMMMSLVTINAGAKEFSDDGDITYKEAVDVISTIKVVDGYAGGDFKPGNNLTRGAAAKIICNMILGPTTAAELHADTAPYRDVPVTSDFAGYIAYCQKEGIISGYADGSFRPAGTLTGYAFMKMLLGALGYDAEIEGYTGPNWSINVAKKAIGLGLNQSLEKTFNGVDFVTREEAALYAFNTLKADLVEYSSKITANVNGAEVAIGNSNAEPQKWESQKTRSDNIYKDGLVQFAEQYFNKLVLTEDMDVFGRPDREWRYDGDDIGAYINMDLFKQEYTTKVTGRDLYDLLGSRTVDEYNFEIRVDGIKTVTENKTNLGSAFFTEGNMIRGNTEKVGETGNGVLTQVFVDNDKDVETVWVAVINTYLAKAPADYNEKKDEADFEVWSLDNKSSSSTDPILVKDPSGQSTKTGKETLTVSGEDFDIENVKENDIVLVRVADGAIQEILDPEVIDDAEITSFKRDNWVKADEQYDYATTAMYDDEVLDEYDLTNMKDTTYRIFLDPYGYAIGVEIVEDTAKYVFLTGIDGNSSNLRNKTADGNLIFTDGTMKTAKINMEKSRALKDGFTGTGVNNKPYKDFTAGALWNTWCTYTVNSDGVYTLTEVANTSAQMNHNDNGVAYSGSGKRTTDKVGQGRNVDELANDTNYTNYIDKKHISLNGLNGPLGTDNSGSNGTASAYSKVYGNDDSVYISVGVSLINDATKINPHVAGSPAFAKLAVIIDDVDSVSTGVQGVSLKAHDWAYLESQADTKIDTAVTPTIADGNQHSYGTYTLFDSHGFVIAAVVVGEDDGVSSKYAYAFNDDVDQESWDKEKKEWTWTKAVIIDGEEVTLTEKGDSLSGLASMNHNEWYEVKFKADETVKSVQHIDSGWNRTTGATTDTANHDVNEYIFCNDNDDTSSNNVIEPSHLNGSTKYPKFVGKIEYVEKAQEDNTSGKVVLFEDMHTNNHAVVGTDTVYGEALKYTLKTAGTSLQVMNATGTAVKGFAVSPNAKTVLVQDVQVWNDDGSAHGGPKIMDNIEYFDGGKTGLERAVKKLNLNNNKSGEYFRGFISAVFENGTAQTVIIYEKLPNDVNWGTDQTPGGSYGVTVANGVITVTPPVAPGGQADDDLLRAVRNELTRLGYTNIKIPFSGSTGIVGTITADKDDINYTFTHTGLNAPSLTSLTVTGSLGNPQYVGMPYDLTGLTITANYAGGVNMVIAHNDANLTLSGDVGGDDVVDAGDTTLTITYMGQPATVSVTPTNRTVTGITATVNAGFKITQPHGTAISTTMLDGISIEVTYNVGPDATIAGDDAGVSITGSPAVTGATASLTLSYGGQSTATPVTVDCVPTTTIAVSGLAGFTVVGTAPTLSGKVEGDVINITYEAATDATSTNTVAASNISGGGAGTEITSITPGDGTGQKETVELHIVVPTVAGPNTTVTVTLG